jgi:hypothetical protein
LTVTPVGKTNISDRPINIFRPFTTILLLGVSSSLSRTGDASKKKVKKILERC